MSTRARATRADARSYVSATRKRQADETRHRIAEAARALFLRVGFAATTVDAIAAEAGVATPTFYAIFKSKRGILAELLDRATFGVAYEALVNRSESSNDPRTRLLLAASIARQIYDAERAEFDLWRGAGMVAPELADIEREREDRRRVAQTPLMDWLGAARALRVELGATEAQDVLWALTGRELYRALVVERGWNATRYETWLGETLCATLLRDVKAPSKAKS